MAIAEGYPGSAISARLGGKRAAAAAGHSVTRRPTQNTALAIY